MLTCWANNGATFVLGGNQTYNKLKNLNGRPLLDSILLLGYLFRSTTDKKRRKELIVLMRPKVTMKKLELNRRRQTTKEKMVMTKDLNKRLPLNQGEYEEEYESSEKELPPPDLPPIREKRGK